MKNRTKRKRRGERERERERKRLEKKEKEKEKDGERREWAALQLLQKVASCEGEGGKRLDPKCCKPANTTHAKPQTKKNRTLQTIPEVHNTRNRSPADATELPRVEQKALQFEVYSLSRGYGALWVWGSDSCGSKLRFRVPDVVGFN